MSALEISLSRLLDSPGVTGVALVDAVTGLTYGIAGDAGEAGDGVECSELAALITDRLCGEAGAQGSADGAGAASGELESVIVTSGRRHHVTLSLRRQGGDPLLLTAGLDREQTNLALAIRSLGERAGDVLA